MFDNVLLHLLLTDTNTLWEADHQITQSFVNMIVLSVGIALAFELVLLALEFKISESRKSKYQNLYRYINLFKEKNILFGIFIIAIIGAISSLGATQYVYRQMAKQDYFSSVYTQPTLHLNQKIKKKNLIIIYVESLEHNLTNKEVFGSNLIEPIDQLPGITIKKFIPTPGTGCTIAGMVASQCAIPLKLPSFNQNIKWIKFFLPNAICLGDILATQGYTQYLFLGSDLKFAQVGKFYRNHGYQHLYGLRELTNNNTDTKTLCGWGHGLNDDQVFTEAFKHIIKAKKFSQPFNVVIMTTDNHAPNGITSPNCHQAEKNNGLMGAYQCSSRFVADFVKKLQKNGILKNTTLIIMGDHPFPQTYKQLKYFPNPRYIYFKIIDSNVKIKPTRDLMTHFDVAPSILDLLNLQLPTTKKFGLGISIFANISPADYQTIFDTINKQSILNPSNTYNSLWHAM